MASTVPIDPVLSNLSVANWQSAEGFIADKVFPIVPVETQSGQYFVLDDSNLNRDTAERRADATESAGDSFILSDDAYNATVFALHKDVGDQLQSNYKNVPGTPFESAAKFLVNRRPVCSREASPNPDRVTPGIECPDAAPRRAAMRRNAPGRSPNWRVSDEFPTDFDVTVPLIDTQSAIATAITDAMPSGLSWSDGYVTFHAARDDSTSSSAGDHHDCTLSPRRNRTWSFTLANTGGSPAGGTYDHVMRRSSHVEQPPVPVLRGTEGRPTDVSGG